MAELYGQEGLYILGDCSQELGVMGDVKVAKQGSVYRNRKHRIKVRGNQTV